MPKLSIITVNLNNKSGLIDTAKSVIAQTWGNYEWIIIDGGSIDGSVEVIKEYANKTNKLVYWCSEPDGGIYQGMNKGIEKASGEYCWFLNSGDSVHKSTTLEEVFASEFDEDILYGDIVFKKETGHYITKKTNYKLSPSKLAYGNLPHQSIFTKTKILKAKNGYSTDFKIISDWLFLVKVICKEKASYKHIPIVFATGLLDGATSLNPKKHKKERNMALKEVFSKKQRFFYFFSIPSLRNKIRKILVLFGRS
ncbi:MAG: glycosyltransferase [Spirochaetaceae bacterium]|nr:glycosyltransferase [Spirochaetaceae bacterium]